MGPSAERSGSGRLLSLACKDCGWEFASPVQVGPDVFAGMTIENCLVRCPLCRYARRYQKDDFSYVEPNGSHKRGRVPEEERISGVRPHQTRRFA